MPLVADQVEYGEAVTMVTIASPSIRNERAGSAVTAATTNEKRGDGNGNIGKNLL